MLAISELPEFLQKKLMVSFGDHWLWIGALRNNNRKDQRGIVRFNGKVEYAHRVVFHLATGFDLSSKLQVNHKNDCAISLCCNPEHLYEGTQKDNVRDSIRMGNNKELSKTHCPKGHEYSISPTTGHRYCQTCKNDRRKEWRNAQSDKISRRS